MYDIPQSSSHRGLTLTKPRGLNAQSSDAKHHSEPNSVLLCPNIRGRMPKGSRKAKRPT